MSSIDALPRALGELPGKARFRVRAEDFFVDEELPFTPDGSGEHLLVQVEKRNNNTAWVAQRLSQFAGIHPRLVSFSGRKDRHAVTRQWFSLQLTGLPDPDWSLLDEPGVAVLAAHRHGRKLRTGTHRLNRFVIVLRDVDAPRATVADRLARIAAEGVPNYFGEQRFGAPVTVGDTGVAMGSNLVQARAAVASGRLPSNPGRRGMVISTLRSTLFNEVLAARVDDGSWSRILPGELVMLDGAGGRWFAEDGDPALAERCAALDIHPGGPLVGTGGACPSGAVAELEARITGRYDDALAALARWRVEGDRRALRSRVGDLAHDWPEPCVLRLSFTLWRGSYATAVLRELLDCVDASAAGESRSEDAGSTDTGTLDD